MKKIILLLFITLLLSACKPTITQTALPESPVVTTVSPTIAVTPTEEPAATATATPGLPAYQIQGRLFEYQDMPGAWHFIGSLQNNTELPLLSADVHLAIEQESGPDFEITFYERQFSPIPPHGIEYIDTGRFDGAKPAKSPVFVATLNNLKYGDNYHPIMLAFENVLERKMSITPTIAGFIRNSSSEAVDLRKVEIVFLDKDGMPVGISAAFYNLSTLMAGKNTPFSASAYKGEYASYKLVYSATLSQGNTTLLQPGDLEFSDWNYFQDAQYGYFHLVGRVTNKTTNLIAIHSSAALLDGNGQVLSANFGNTYPGILLPGETTLVAINDWFYRPPNSGNEIGQVLGFANLAATFSAGSQTIDLQISGANFYVDQTLQGQQFTIKGIAYNPNPENLPSCSVSVEIYDKANSKLWGAGEMQFQGDLGAKTSAPFSIQLPRPANMDIALLTYKIKGRCFKMQ